MAPPPNDDFANATLIAGASGFVDGTSVDATDDWPDVEQAFGNGNTWFKWVCPADGAYQFDTDALPDVPGNLNATAITSYIDGEGAGFTSLVFITYDIFGTGSGPPGTSRSKIVLAAKAGVTYYIEVDDYDGAGGGAYRLTWSKLTATSPPQDVEADFADHANSGYVFTLTANTAFPVNLGDKVYAYEIWRGPSADALTLIATVHLGTDVAADIESFTPLVRSDLDARLDVSDDATIGWAVYWDAAAPAGRVFYQIKAINSFGSADSPVYAFPRIIRFSDPPVWRVIVTNLAGKVLTSLDKRSTDRSFVYTLNQPAVHTGVVASDDPEINIPAPDFDSPAFLSHNTRLVYGFRREAPPSADPWVCRFAGIVNNIEDSGADLPTSRYTASDPWQYLYSRPVRDPDTGALPLRIGLKFKDARASDIAVGLLAATVAVDGDVFIDASDSGLIEATDVITGITTFEQGISVGEAWQRLCDTGTIDIYLRPIYDPFGRPGKLCQLEIYKRAGSTRFNAVFGWDKASRSLDQVSRLIDGTRLANNIKIFSGQGGAADQIPVQTDALSETTYGSYWSQQSQVDSEGQAALVELAALADLELRKRAPRTLQFSASPERAYLSLRDYDIGDYVPVWSSRNLREPLGVDYDAFDPDAPGAAGYQRIHVIPVNVDDDGVERVTNVITEDSGVSSPAPPPPDSGFDVAITGGTGEGDTLTAVVT